ncbi:MAG: hypothetical protein AB7N24_22030 [Dehalococcoidia bacterium]
MEDLGLRSNSSAHRPADTGDYLDNVQAKVAAPPRLQRGAETSTPRREVGEGRAFQAMDEDRAPKEEVKSVKRSPRKEVTFDRQSLAMVGELMEFTKKGEEQNPRASELVRALVQVAYDARRFADFSRLRLRGQNGSANAEAYLADLRNVLLKAIGQLYVDRYSTKT